MCLVLQALSSDHVPHLPVLLMLRGKKHSRKIQSSYHIRTYYIDNDEIPGFLLSLKSHIFTMHSEDVTNMIGQLQESFLSSVSEKINGTTWLLGDTNFIFSC